METFLKEHRPFDARSLLAWFKVAARPLPWREKYDPYQVVLSEYMLQQTQVDTALPYFHRWLKQWPDWASLANADEDAVRACWKGLGYYQRGQRLLALARHVAGERQGRMPEDEADLQELPGIGPYTAAAISAIAFNRAAFPIDGNVRRVLSRWFADHRESPGVVQDEFFKQQLIPIFGKCKKRRELAQAIMELGALICSPKNPKCDICPLRLGCRANEEGCAAQLPRKKKKAQSTELYFSFCWVCDSNGRVLLRRRPDQGRFASFWEAPNVEAPTAEESRQLLKKMLAIKTWKQMPAFRRDFTSYKVMWQPHVHQAKANFRLPDFQWYERHEVAAMNVIPVLGKHYRENMQA